MTNAEMEDAVDVFLSTVSIGQLLALIEREDSDADVGAGSHLGAAWDELKRRLAKSSAMSRLDYLTVVAMEECDEVSQRLSKALRFGWEQVQALDGQSSTPIKYLRYSAQLGRVTIDR